jgi:hypothetical protein
MGRNEKGVTTGDRPLMSSFGKAQDGLSQALNRGSGPPHAHL